MSAQRTMQRRIVRELCATMRKRMLENINKTPEQWNGRELRQWFADIAGEDINYLKMDRARMREYQNERLTRNL